jgi:hypothetical protein
MGLDSVIGIVPGIVIVDDQDVMIDHLTKNLTGFSYKGNIPRIRAFNHADAFFQGFKAIPHPKHNLYFFDNQMPDPAASTPLVKKEYANELVEIALSAGVPQPQIAIFSSQPPENLYDVAIVDKAISAPDLQRFIKERFDAIIANYGR